MKKPSGTCIDPRAPGAPTSRAEEMALLAGDDLPEIDARRAREHAERCPACGALLAELRESGAALALLATEVEPSDSPGGLEAASLERVRAGVRSRISAISAREASPRAARSARSGAPRWALAAALLVSMLAAVVWTRSGLGPTGRAGDGPVPAPAPHHERADREAARGDAPAGASGEGPPRPAPEDRPAAAPAPAPPDGRTPTETPSAPRVARAAPSPSGTGSSGADPGDTGGPATRGHEVVAPRGAATTDPAQAPITIRVVSDDPDIVFYWLVEPEEIRDETVSS